MEDASPGYVAIAKASSSLWWAVDHLVETVGPARLRKLKVRAGEHLAAILTTCFLNGEPPTHIDEDGGPDLVFGNFSADDWRGHYLSDKPPAFEIKTMPGPFRHVESQMNKAIRLTGTAEGMGVTVTARSAKDTLDEVRPLIFEARTQLESKVQPGFSQNAFVIVHPFDRLVTEAFDAPILGPYLPRLRGIGDLASVWLLLAPSHLVVWSTTRQEWLNLIFAEPDESDERQAKIVNSPYDALQGAELYLFEKIGFTEPSPYTFSIRSRED